MTIAAPMAVVLAMSICGVGVTLSGCGGTPKPPWEPATLQDAWQGYRDAFERRNITALMMLFPESSDRNCKTQYVVEDRKDGQYVMESLNGNSFDTKFLYGAVLQGMVASPSIIDVVLDLNSPDPKVIFVWSGPGVDIAADMIAWDEQSLRVKWHQAYVKKNAEYGQKLGVKTRAMNAEYGQKLGVKTRAIGTDADDPGNACCGIWMETDYYWNSRNMTALLGYYGNESKLLASSGGSLIEEFVGPTRIRSFFEGNPTNMGGLYFGPPLSLEGGPPENMDGAHMMIGVRINVTSKYRLLSMFHALDAKTVKLQVVVQYQGNRLVPFVV